MRNASVRRFTVVLFSTLLFLVAVPQGALGQNRAAIAKEAVSLLTPFVKTYLEDLRAHTDSEQIKIRVLMHNGDPQLNGCGFFFTARGHSGGIGSDFFPTSTEHRCGDGIYRLRMASRGVMYDKTIHLGNQHVKEIELHSDGWYNTFVNVMCFGFTERTIDGGPRAFCINNLLVKGCKSLLNKWNDIDVDWDDLLMTRTTRGAHKIIFRDVEKVVSAIEKLEKNPDNTDAVYTVCDRMELERGTENAHSWDCPADKLRTALNNTEALDERNAENTNPYGCSRWSG